jgi:hypothetical protein
MDKLVFACFQNFHADSVKGVGNTNNILIFCPMGKYKDMSSKHIQFLEFTQGSVCIVPLL